MTRWLETDSLSNQDISSALAIGAYTADADRLILARVTVSQVAGNGDYILYATIQDGGAGNEHRFLPITDKATAASGVTDIAAVSMFIPVRSGDVVKIYVDGLAGDTTTPDTKIVWFEIAALRPATADRTLLVDASGHVTASNTIPTAGAVADAVWDEALAGHAVAGSAGKALSDAGAAGDPWGTDISIGYSGNQAGALIYAFTNRSDITVVTAVSGSRVTVYQYDTWRFTISDSTLSLTDYDVVSFVVKRGDVADDSAMLYVRDDVDLVRINGAAATATDGSLTVDSATQFTVLVAASVTDVTPGSYTWTLKAFDTGATPDEAFTLASGRFDVEAPGLRAVV